MSLFRSCSSAIVFLFALSIPAIGQDWPQWNGPTRDGLLSKGFAAKPIPKDGLVLKWKLPVSYGYSSPVVANGKVFVSDYQLESGKITNNAGSRDRLTGKERVHCIDAKTGKSLWTHQYDRKYSLSYPGGPRAAPVVVDGTVFTLGAEGDLCCLSIEQGGKVLWQRPLAEEYKTEKPMWGYASVPLVIGDQLICLAGGPGSLVVSLERKTGKELWRALSGDEIGYCPPALISHGGVSQLLIWSPEKISSLNPTNGQLYWEQPFKPDYGMSIAPPILRGDFLFASGEGISAMFQLSSNPPKARFCGRRILRNRWGFPIRQPSSRMGMSMAPTFRVELWFASDRTMALACGKQLWQQQGQIARKVCPMPVRISSKPTGATILYSVKRATSSPPALRPRATKRQGDFMRSIQPIPLVAAKSCGHFPP